MRDLIVLGGSSHPNLTKSICRNLTIEQSRVDSRKFANGEISIEVKTSVREKMFSLFKVDVDMLMKIS